MGGILMKKTYLIKKSFALIITLVIALSINTTEISAASNYYDTELARAVNLGFGTYKSTNHQITYAQFMQMLDHTVALVDKSILPKWKKVLPEARKSDKKMTRYNGMLAIFYAANFIGGNCIEFNADWVSIHDKIGEVMEEFGADHDIWGDWPDKNVNAGFKDAVYTYDWPNGSLAYFYSFGRMSILSRNTIFSYSAEKNSMRFSEKFTYKEALLAALRLYESVVPELGDRYATAEDKIILNKAEERKQSILNSPTTLKIIGTSYYVSNEGNDDNDGLTPETAWATIDKVNNTVLKYGDGVFFRRGDLWRVNPLLCSEGITYSAYDNGEKPRIYGSLENSSGAYKWNLMEGSKNIWVYYKDMPFCGYMVFNEGESFAKKKWVYWNGKQYIKDGTNKKFIVNELKNLEYFNEVNLTGWDNYVDSDLIVYNCTRRGKLYLRCDEGNPGIIYPSIEISPINGQVSLVQLSKDNVIDNLCFKYYGNCGITGSGTVQNCELAYFGGANFAFYSSEKRTDGAGGGINVGTSSGEGMHIFNNYIHESYDEGITIECGWNGEDYNEIYNNITVKDNLFEKNRRDCWISSFMEDRKGIIFKNISYEGNMFLHTGSSAGNRSNPSSAKDAGIAINDPGERNIENVVIKNNTFYLPRFVPVYINSSRSDDFSFSGNTYVINNNAIFLARGDDAGKYYYNYDENAPEQYLNDLTSTILPLSVKPSLSLSSGTDKIGGKYKISLENVNSITKVTYKTTSGSKYISVSSEGIVTAKKEGTAKITVTFSNGIDKDINQIFTFNVKK